MLRGRCNKENEDEESSKRKRKIKKTEIKIKRGYENSSQDLHRQPSTDCPFTRKKGGEGDKMEQKRGKVEKRRRERKMREERERD